MVPVRAKGDSIDPGDKERFRPEGEILNFELDESCPASRLCKSSPRRESLWLRPRCWLGEKRTLRVLPLRCLFRLCPSGVVGANVEGLKWEESVRGCVSSSSAAPGEKKAGPSSSVTDTMSSLLRRDVVLKRGRLSRVARDDAVLGDGRSLKSSLPSFRGCGAAPLKLRPAKPMAAWKAPLSATGEMGPSSSSSGILERSPDGEETYR
jgi:hypothetical protein